jgi:uncharacterized protein (TIGR00255 family)
MDSMTGYGNAEGQIDDTSYLVEIKTVNNRYFKGNIKLPEPLAFLEPDIEQYLRKNLHRGSINYTLRFKNSSASMAWNIDESLLKKATEKLVSVTGLTGIKYNIDVASLLMLPGILKPATPDEQQSEKYKNAVLQVTQLAMERLKQMREQEGSALAADLKRHCEYIKEKVEQINQRSGVVVKEYHNRLQKKADELLSEAKLELDPETLAREVAVFAERSDISEELARLDSHLEQFLNSCLQEKYPGRKLEFIAQELLREANTVASKAADTEIARCIVEIKCHIDRLKEQVQNIE